MQLRSLGVNTNSFLLLALSLLFAANVKAAFVTVDGFDLEYEIAGAGLDDWNSVFSSIAEQTKVIRYSRVGNGNSTAIKRHFTSMEYADHLSEFLLALEISKPVILVAHSYGGSIARDFSAKYPQQLNALLMLDPSSEHDVDILRAINLEEGNKEIAQIKLTDMANGMSNQYLDFWSKRPLPDYPQIKDIPVTVIASVRKVAEPSNLFYTDKGRIMWGEMWQSWAAEFPQGHSVLTEKSGHFIQNDEPMLVQRELRRLRKILDENKHP